MKFDEAIGALQANTYFLEEEQWELIDQAYHAECALEHFRDQYRILLSIQNSINIKINILKELQHETKDDQDISTNTST